MVLREVANGALFIAVGVLPAVLVLRDVRVRLLALIFGAILVFQSGSEVGATKIAYLGLFALVFALTLHDRTTRLKRSSIAVGVVLGGAACLSVVRGREPAWVFRDATNYFLLIAAAAFAVHFGDRLEERFIRRVATVVGLVGCYAFSAQWITNRGLGNLPAPGVPSTALFAIGVSLASARAVVERRPTRWWALTGVMLAAGIATGTRNMLLMVLAPLAVIVSAVRSHEIDARRIARRAASRAAIVLPLVVAAAFVAVRLADVDTSAALDRISTVLALDDRGNRASYDDRRVQQSLAAEAVRSNPVLGSGPGTIWVWEREASRSTAAGISMDTSLAIPAKWGALGTVALLVLLWRWWYFIRPRFHR